MSVSNFAAEQEPRPDLKLRLVYKTTFDGRTKTRRLFDSRVIDARGTDLGRLPIHRTVTRTSSFEDLDTIAIQLYGMRVEEVELHQ